MDNLILAIKVSTLVIIATVVYLYWKFKDFPPGPWGMPVVGYVTFLGQKPHVKLVELSKKYGRVMSMNLGNDQAVIVNGWEAVREVLIRRGDMYSGRPFVKIFDIMLQGRDNDIVMTNGPVNKELKLVSTKILKDFGLGHYSLESVVAAEAEKLSEHLKSFDGKSVDIDQLFFVPLLNIIWGITAGVAIDMSDVTMKSLADALHTLGNMNSIGIINAFPFLRFVVPECTGYRRLNNAAKYIMDYIDKVVDQHLEGAGTTDGGEKKRDFINSFQEEIEYRKSVNKDQPPYCKNNLSGATFDFLAAGIETTDTTMVWALLLMSYYPDIQKRVQAELDHVVDNESHISYSSKQMIPFTEATLCEIQRFATILPLSVPHCTTKDTVLFGHKIPGGTSVYTNIWSLHHEKEYWGDPEKFRPERFLDDEGRLAKHERFIPFSAGPRVCLGEPLAKMELTLFFSCLMRRFSFEMDPNHAKSESALEPIVGVVLRPRPFSLMIKCR